MVRLDREEEEEGEGERREWGLMRREWEEGMGAGTAGCPTEDEAQEVLGFQGVLRLQVGIGTHKCSLFLLDFSLCTVLCTFVFGD
jgi:hypothetical protein